MDTGSGWRVFGADQLPVVVNTAADGTSAVYQAGCYLDQVVRTEQGLRFKSKRCIYDTLRVQTVLAFPI